MGPFPDWDQVPLDQAFTMHSIFEAADPASFPTEYGQTVRRIATRGELGANRELIVACPNLEVFSVYGVGFDAVDLDACRKRKVRLTNTPDVLIRDVANLGVAMMLCLARGVIGAATWVRKGDWVRNGHYPLQCRVHGAKSGVLGLGRIGLAVARQPAGFNMEIAYSDVKPRDHASDWTYIEDPVALADYADCPYVTLADSDGTRSIVGRGVIEALGSEGMVINISRSSNIDEDVLPDALESSSLSFAEFNVFEGEPELNPRFLKLDNVRLQPHHASGTVKTRKAMGRLVSDNLTAHLAGQPLLTPVL